MDAGARATKGEGEEEAGVEEEVGDEVEQEFLYGWSEMKQKGEGEAWKDVLEEEIKEQMWEVEVAEMQVGAGEELMEDQGSSLNGPEVYLQHPDFLLNLPRSAAAQEELACDWVEGSLHRYG